MNLPNIYEIILIFIIVIFAILTIPKYNKLKEGGNKITLTKNDVRLIFTYTLYMGILLDKTIWSGINWILFIILLIILATLIRFNWKVNHLITDYYGGNFVTIGNKIKSNIYKISVFKAKEEDLYALRLTNVKVLGSKILFCKKEIYNKLLNENVVNNKLEESIRISWWLW